MTDRAQALSRYDEACRALAEARRVDDVKDVGDRAAALQEYGRRARNRGLEVDAAEIRIRAERRLGEMLAELKADGRLARAAPGNQYTGNPHTPEPRPRHADIGPVPAPEQVQRGSAQASAACRTGTTLAELGVDRKLSSRAQQLAALPPASFEAQVACWRARAETDGERVTATLVRGEAGLDKRAVRDRRERDLAARQVALPDRRFGVIYADPEWRFEPFSRESGMDRAADNHYPTSATEAIAARPVAVIAAADSVLFLWATMPMLPDALAVMAAWGFGYRSHVVWRKIARSPGGNEGDALAIGTGYWFRCAHELLLVGARGQIPAPAMGTQFPSVVDAPPGRHSQKPERFAELIESYYPHLPKIELNARAARPGWAAWGWEAPESVAA